MSINTIIERNRVGCDDPSFSRVNQSFATLRTILIGTRWTVVELGRQLGLLGGDGPIVVGALLMHPGDGDEDGDELRKLGIEVLGVVDDLEEVMERVNPDLAIVSLPGVMGDAVTRIRTKLRRLGIADRFIATLADQINGVGPRTAFEVSVGDLIDRPTRAIDEEAIGRTIRGKRVLITGAGGSIGSELARIAAEYEPRELFLMERSENALFEIDRQIARAHPELRRGVWLHDVTDVEKTLAYCVAARPEVIFHTAAHKHVPMMEDHPGLAVGNNFFGTKSIADAARQTGCERFVMISTDKAVNPSSVMGATKRLAEWYVQYLNQRSDTIFEIVRFGNVLGSAGSVLPTWMRQIRDGGPVTVTHPEMTRFFMTIPEAAALVVQAAALDEVGGGDVVVLDMGEALSILGLAQRLIEQFGLGWVVPTDPAFGTGSGNGVGVGSSCDNKAGLIPIVFTGIRPGEKLHEELVYRDENMHPSPYDGIRIWEAAVIPDSEMIGDMVATLTEACERGDAETVVTAIMRLVPEMRSGGRRGGRRSLLSDATGMPAVETVNLANGSHYHTGIIAKDDPSKVA